MNLTLNRFAKFAWGVLAFNVLVIIWGAFVRATGSGAGCGQHWPSCQGDVIPFAPAIETVIEFTHRLTSGTAFILVVVMLMWAFKSYPAGHIVRRGAGFSMLFMIAETLVGASLVLFGWVAYNQSTIRAVVMAIHLINTFLLMASITLTAWWASGGQPAQLKGQGGLGTAIGIGFLGILVLGASGGVTALGDTLFPAGSLTEGIAADFSSTAHFLVRLRVYHPVIAVLVGVYNIVVMVVYNAGRGTSQTRVFAKAFISIFVLQLIFGAFNVVLLAPVWMQLTHLFITDMLLIVYTLFVATALALPIAAEQTAEAPHMSAQPSR